MWDFRKCQGGREVKFIANWREKALQCARCGETRSVKYESENKSYCNKCIMLIEIKNTKKKNGGE